MGFLAYLDAVIPHGGFPVLTIGSRGPGVMLVQELLNADPVTEIAATGPGSPGHETTYYGPLTREAVIRFQEKYADTVLLPHGIFWPTGVAGAYTQEQFIKLCNGTSN